MSPEKQWELPPVTALVLYANDTVVKRRQVKNKRKVTWKRGKIMEFSEQARKRLAFIASNTEVHFQSMVTLTYPAEYTCDGKMVKRQLYRFLEWVREIMPGAKYLWFLEFQKRGAPHFHILLDKQPAHYGGTWPTFQFSVAGTWNKIVKGGYDHLRAGTRSERLRSSEGGKHYVVKYAQKMRQKTVPERYWNVGRFYGYNKGVRLEAKVIVPASWQDVRNLLGDWRYLPDNEQQLYRVLFNTSGAVATKAVQANLL